MSSEFTYPSFRCVLKYLEANKRIHICSRSKTLQKIDRKIPLHIKRLDLSGGYVIVNEITISLTCSFVNFRNGEKVLVDGAFRNWNQVLMPGDVCLKDGDFYKLPNTENLEVQYQKPLQLKFYQGKNQKRRVPPDIPRSVAIKTAATVLFGGRSLIHVFDLLVSGSVLRLPVGVNLRIRHFSSIGTDNLNEIVRIIDPLSLPLKTVKISSKTPGICYHPIVQTAETLETWPDQISIFQEPWHREALTLPHKHLKLNLYDSAYEEIVSLVQGWLDHPREHGRSLAVYDLKRGMVKRLYQIKSQFNAKVALIPGNKNEKVYPNAVIIPINSISELLISCVGEEEIKLESVPTGKIQSSNSVYLTYLDVKWSLSNRIQEYSEKSYIEVIFRIFMCIFGLGTIFYSIYDI